MKKRYRAARHQPEKRTEYAKLSRDRHKLPPENSTVMKDGIDVTGQPIPTEFKPGPFVSTINKAGRSKKVK